MSVAEPAADALTAAGILKPGRPLNFIHPVVAAAIVADLSPVSRLTTFAFVLIANPALPARTIPELLDTARSKPGTLTCGAGAALQQLACELLKVHGRIDMTTVPYKGSAPAMNDLLGGQISFVFEVPNVAVGPVKANRVRALATTGTRPGAGPFAHLPAINDTLTGFEVESWFGVLAPRATPREIVLRLNREFGGILAEEGVRKRLLDYTGDEFDKVLRLNLRGTFNLTQPRVPVLLSVHDTIRLEYDFSLTAK